MIEITIIFWWWRIRFKSFNKSSNFRKYFSNEIYYDCGDEEAPFGSDEGHDAFSELEESVRKEKENKFFLIFQE